MKRTLQFSLPLVTAVAAAVSLSACDAKDEWEAQGPSRICTDRDGRRIMDAECARPAGSAGGAALWYYYGAGHAIAGYGQRAYGGSYEARPGIAYSAPSRASDATRGGFGRSGLGLRSGG